MEGKIARALRVMHGLQVRDDACPICGTCYTAADAVPLNGTPEQVRFLGKCKAFGCRAPDVGVRDVSLCLYCCDGLSGLLRLNTAAW